MKFVTTLCAAFIHVHLIIYCTAEENFDKILNDCYPEVTLPQSEIDFLKNLSPNLWKERVKISKKHVKTADDLAKDLEKTKCDLKEMQLKLASNLFTCAITRSKNIIQWYNKDGMDIMRLPESSEYTGPPTFYLDLIVQQQMCDRKYTTVNNFNKLCKQWYYFITKMECIQAKILKTNLQLYFDRNPKRYGNIVELHTVFCASVARSNRLFNYLWHTFLPSFDLEEFGIEENELTKFLFDKVKFYYFGQDDLDFINILFKSRASEDEQDGKVLDNRYFLKYKVVNNPNLKSVIIKNARGYQCNNVNNKEVLLPLSDVCPRENLESTSLIVPI